MEINKSSRHTKIIGDFGEHLLCNWFSRSGFEVARVDHTGIDIVAYHPITKQRLGITVKLVTRDSGKENGSVNILSYQDKDDRRKVLDAEAFGAEPWIAIYIETSDYGELFLTSLNHYDEKYRGNEERKIDDWKMTKKYQEEYQKDPNIKHIRIEFVSNSWEWPI